MSRFKHASMGLAFGLGMFSVAAASAQTLRIGMDSEAYPPFYSQQSDGSWSGWEIDMLKAVCDQMKVTCEVERMAWDGLIPALSQNKVDFIWSSMTINGEREKVIDFTHYYYKTPNVIVGAKDDHKKVDCGVLDSLSGRAIGVQGGTNYSSYLQASAPKSVSVKSYDVMDNVLADLSTGRLDYALEGKSTFSHFLADHSDFEVKSVCPDNDILGGGVGAGLRKQDQALRDQLSAAIVAVANDGTWDVITKRYPVLSGSLTKP